MAVHEVARADGVHVLSEKCATCIFRPGNLMSLHPGRVKGMVEMAVEAASCIPCHKTTYGQADPAICRGFWDSYRHRVSTLQIAERLDFVVFDLPPK